MIELALTEEEFNHLHLVFHNYSVEALGKSLVTEEEKVIIKGIDDSFQTAGRPLNYTSENKPRIKDGN